MYTPDVPPTETIDGDRGMKVSFRTKLYNMELRGEG